MHLTTAFGWALLVSLLAWLTSALTKAGAVAALLVGLSVLRFGGYAGGIVLLTFFVTGSLLSRFGPDPAAARKEAKGARRDAWQVLANGGAAAAGALLLPGAALWIIVLSLAVATADTWATTFGGWSRTPPRNILTGEPVVAGTSGGVTFIGSFGGLAGAACLGLVGALAAGDARLFPLSLLVGFAGMLLDSVLGAGMQARFECPSCRVSTERPLHRCGTRTVHLSGWRWLTNDGVNLVATAAGAVAGLGMWAAWH